MYPRGFPLTDRDDSELLTLDDAAQEFGVSRRTLERLRQNGSLPGVRCGRYLRVRRGDVRRSLTFSDPIPLMRNQLSASPEVLVEDWMQGWIQLTSRVPAPDSARLTQRRWAEEASRRYGTWKLSEYQVRHALDAASAAGVDGAVEIVVLAMRGIPEDRLVLDVLRELVPLLNPLIEHLGDGQDGTGRGPTA
jgi:excisionase family DNA binding protein